MLWCGSMPSAHALQNQLARLRLVSINTSLFKSVDNGKTLKASIKEFKDALVTAIRRNAISDECIVQSADCLYDLKAADNKVNNHICKIVEERPTIYTRPLYGGVLWSFYTSAGLNTRRKKVVNSSCNASLVSFLDELFALQSDDKLAAKLESTLWNMAIVGKCYKLPISTRARLEQAIVDAKEALSRALNCSPVSASYIFALRSLQVRCEAVAEHAVASFLSAAAYHELMPVNTYTKVMRTLNEWTIGPVGSGYSALKLLNRQLLSSPPQLLLKSTPALAKCYVAASRIRTGNVNHTKVGDSTENVAHSSAPDEVISNDNSNRVHRQSTVLELSTILLGYCCDVIVKFNSHHLLLLYNSLAQNILADGEHYYVSGDLNKYVRVVTTEVRDALHLDSSVVGNDSSLPSRPYDKQDLFTIHRSALITSRVCKDPSEEVASIAKGLLGNRYGVQPDTT